MKTIKDLLHHDGVDFINEAYTHILSRKPDKEGLAYYLRRLQYGYSKESLIYQLYKSPERNGARTSIKGIFKIIFLQKLLEMPIINYHLKLKKLHYLLYSTKLDHQIELEKIKIDHQRSLQDIKQRANFLARAKFNSNLTRKSDPAMQDTSECMSKVVLLSMVKNEADIIESFIRHNNIFFDKIIIVDNGSTDETRRILELLKDEGLPIDIESDEILGYSQSEKMTKRYIELTKHTDFDYLVIIDADEFIDSNDKNFLRKALKNKDTKYYFEWNNYVPIGVGQNDISDPLRLIKYRNTKKTLRKVVIPNFGEESLFVKIWQGNHDFDFDIRHLHFEILEAKLAHFPVRSINQIESKALIGWPSYLIKNKHARWSHEGLQWRVIYERIEESQISQEDLTAIADCYSDVENLDFENYCANNLVLDPVTPNYNSIKYWKSPLKSAIKIAKFCETIIEENWNLRDQVERLRATSSKVIDCEINANTNERDQNSENISPNDVIDGRDRDFETAGRYFTDFTGDLATSLDIIFISESKHAKFQTLRYRCFNIIDHLSSDGWRCGLAYSFDINDEWIKRVRPKIAVLVRVDESERIEKLINTFRSEGVKIIFDIDDFVFDETVFLQKLTISGIAKIPELLNSDWARPYRQEAKYYQHLIKSADAVTTTTPYLAEKIAALNHHSYVIRNSLSASQIEATKGHFKTKEDDYIRIGYFSGSPTHNSDFMVAAEALYFVMRRHPEVRLVLVGFINPPDFLLALGASRIERHPPLDAAAYFNVIARCDINIAPLEDTKFNQGKSELKVFEAAAWGIPTVASPTDTLIRCINDGYDGIIAHDRDAWENALDRLVSDAAYRSDLGQAAKFAIAGKFTFQESGRCAADIYSKLINKN